MVRITAYDASSTLLGTSYSTANQSWTSSPITIDKATSDTLLNFTGIAKVTIQIQGYHWIPITDNTNLPSGSAFDIGGLWSDGYSN